MKLEQSRSDFLAQFKNSTLRVYSHHLSSSFPLRCRSLHANTSSKDLVALQHGFDVDLIARVNIFCGAGTAITQNLGTRIEADGDLAAPK